MMVDRIGSKKADNLLSATAVEPIIYIELRIAFRIRLTMTKFVFVARLVYYLGPKSGGIR